MLQPSIFILYLFISITRCLWKSKICDIANFKHTLLNFIMIFSCPSIVLIWLGQNLKPLLNLFCQKLHYCTPDNKNNHISVCRFSEKTMSKLSDINNNRLQILWKAFLYKNIFDIICALCWFQYNKIVHFKILKKC